MDREIFINSNSNIILAEGHSRGFWHSWKAISLGLLLGALVLFGLLIYGISRGFPWPANVAMVAMLTPDEAERLPLVLRQALPADWQSALSCGTSWPVALGVYQKEEAWYTFIVAPSWCPIQSEKPYVTKHGLILFYTDTIYPSHETRSFLGLMMDGGSGQPKIGFEPETLGALTGLSDSNASGTLAWFRGDDALLRSSLRLPEAPSEGIPAADLSLRFPQAILPEGIPYLPDIARRSRLPNLIQTDAVFGDEGPDIMRISFAERLDEQDAAALLGAYGFSTRRAITLPDGSISFERVEPTVTSGTTLLGIRRDETGRQANTLGSTFTLTAPSSTPDIPLAPGCSNSGAWARLSAKTVSTLLNRIGLPMQPADVRPIQIVTDKGKLAVCFE